MIHNYKRLFRNTLSVAALFLVSILVSNSANAQVTLYSFSQVMGTYTPITGGTVLASGAGFWDDDTFGPVPIGFTFTYNGTNYTDIGIAANGYLKFGAVPYCCYYNGTSIQNETECIHPFSEDLLGNTATCELSYMTIGTPGSQIFIVQWKDWGFYNVTGAEMNFQARLYEGSNIIEFAYSPGTVVTTATCQVGLTGQTTADFNSRTTTTDWTATTASAVNTAQMTFNAGVNPPSGLSYFWTLAPVDMAPVSLTTPQPNLCYSTTETVTIRLQNFGSQMIDFSVNPVTLSSSVAGPNPQVFAPVVINTGTLATSGTLDVVVSTTYDMSAPGIYTFSASTNTSGDGNPANDNMANVAINTVGTASALPASDSICQGSNATLILTGYNGNIQWQSFNGVSWVNETGPGNNTASYSVSPSATTNYRALICGSAVTNTVTIYVIVVASPTTTGDTRCGYGVVNLSASGVGTLNWYTTPTGGSPINTGPTYSPTVSATTTYYVESSVGSSNTSPVTTTFAGGNGFLGNMFDITAITSVTITHFDGHMTTGSADWEIWYRPGTFVGHETDSTGWTHLGTAYGVVAAGFGVPTPIPLTFAVPIPAGQTYAFYVTATSGQVNYTNGTAVGNVYASDAFLQVREGKGGGYFGVTFSPRIFNGKVYYESGCASFVRTACTATVTFADTIALTASQTSICGNPASVTVTLNASSLNTGYNYSWTGADLNSSSGPSVTATPNATTTYTVTGDDGVCANTASIVITLTLPPPTNATATPNPLCLGQQSQFNTPLAEFQIGSGTLTNTTTSYPAPFGNFWTGDRNQNLILASELLAAGMTAGPINAVSFEMQGINTPALGTYTNFTVSVGTTGLSSLTTAFVTGLTPVYFAASVMPVVGWTTLNFSTPFNWDGVSNIVIETTFMQCSTCPGTPCVNYTLNCIHYLTNTPFTSTIDAHADFNCGITTAVTGTTYNQRPNIRLSGSSYTYLWSPATYLSSATINNPVFNPTTTGNFTYSVLVTTPNGCTNTSSVTVTVVNVPSAPTSSNITRCGTGMVTLTATAGGPGTLQWWDAPIGGNMVGTGSPLTVGPLSASTNYWVEEYDGACPGPRTMVSVTVTPADTVIATAVTNPICQGTTTQITMSSIDPGYNYTWTPSTGLNTTVGDTVIAGPPFSTTYTINAIDGAGCESSTTISVTVNPSPVVINATAVPPVVCAGSNSQLDVNYILPPTNYFVNPIPYNPQPAPTNNAVLIPTGFWTAGDEGLTAPVNIGFNFTFFGNTYSTVSINSNGHLQFTPNPTTSTYAPFTPLPFVIFPLNPNGNDIVAGIWSDLDQSMGGTITYGTTGTTPNQKFIVDFNNVPVYGDLGSAVSFQIILNEFDYSIEVHLTQLTTTSIFLDRACGIQNGAGTVGFTPPGRNTGTWTLSGTEAWQFIPQIPYLFNWTPSSTVSNDTITNPVASPTSPTLYTVSVTDPTFNCTSTATVNVDVYPLPNVTVAPLNSVCIDASPVTLTVGTPTGGTYSGTGVSNNIFYPSVSGVGTFTINYSFTDTHGCSGSGSTTITVNPLPVVTFPTLPSICATGYPLNLNTATPSGGTYSGPGVSGNVFDPTVNGTGIYGITYTYTDLNGCSNSAMRNINVRPSPTVTVSPDTVQGNDTLQGSATGGAPPYTYNWYPCLSLDNCNILHPVANPSLSTNYVLIVIDANGCFSSDTVYVISTVGIGTVPVETVEYIIYPNPSSALFNIVFLHPNDKTEINVTNLLGQEVFNSGSITAPSIPYQIDMTSQRDGVYMMQVKYKDRIFTTRLILNK